MKRNFIASALLAAAFSAGAAGISSPSGNLVLNVSVNDSGSPTYSLSYKGKTLVADSRLGLVATRWVLPTISQSRPRTP